MVKNTNIERKNAREHENFLIFSAITESLFNRATLKESEENAHFDCRLTGYTSGGSRKYAIELKWQNNVEHRFKNYDQRFYITTNKYFYLMDDVKKWEWEMICYICDNGEYYIFNLKELISKKPIRDIPKGVLPLKDTQYSNNKDECKIPTSVFFLDAKDAVIKGRWK